MADLTVTGSATVAFGASATISAPATVSDALATVSFVPDSWKFLPAGAATVSFGGASQATIQATIGDAATAVSPVGNATVSAPITISGAATAAMDGYGLGSGSALTAAQALNGVVQKFCISVRPRVWNKIRVVATDPMDFNADMADYGRTQNNPNYSEKLPL